MTQTNYLLQNEINKRKKQARKRISLKTVVKGVQYLYTLVAYIAYSVLAFGKHRACLEAESGVVAMNFTHRLKII